MAASRSQLPVFMDGMTADRSRKLYLLRRFLKYSVLFLAQIQPNEAKKEWHRDSQSVAGKISKTILTF